jgi:hypothetical protein
VVPRESVQGDFKEQPVLVQRVPQALVQRVPVQQVLVLQLQALVQPVLTQPVPSLQAPVEPSLKWCPDWLQVLAQRESKLAQWLPAQQRAALLCCPSVTSDQ